MKGHARRYGVLEDDRRAVVERGGIVLETVHHPGQRGEDVGAGRRHDIETQMDGARLVAGGKGFAGIDRPVFVITAGAQGADRRVVPALLRLSLAIQPQQPDCAMQAADDFGAARRPGLPGGKAVVALADVFDIHAITRRSASRRTTQSARPGISRNICSVRRW